jgi:predicted AAA+ superfamily ATPase
VDKSRRSGQFLLTGSANVLLLPSLSESLAGRMQIIRLWTLSQGEILGHKESFLNSIDSGAFKELSASPVSQEQLIRRVLEGGYPEPLSMQDERDVGDWFSSYITTILTRDIRELANIDRLSAMPNLFMLMASRSGGLMNVADISSSSGIPHTTLTRYIAVLEGAFILQLLPPWSPRLGKRLTKSKKIYLSDTGLSAYLLGVSVESIQLNRESFGRILENFVLLELMKQETWSDKPFSFYHFRTTKGDEVDFILEDKSGKFIGIEVKASKSASSDDIKGLLLLAKEFPKLFRYGIVFYTGDQVYPLATNIWAVPIACLWN